MRRVGGPVVKHQSKSIPQQFGDHGLDKLRQCWEAAQEGRQQDRVTLDVHSHGRVLDGTERQQAIDHPVIPGKVRTRLRRREEALDQRLRQLLVRRQ